MEGDMNLSSKTLRVLAGIITGDETNEASLRVAPYRTLSEITDFFYDFGERDLHPASGGPSRANYTMEKLKKLNGTEQMGLVICRAIESVWDDRTLNPEHTGAHLNDVLRKDGYEVTLEKRHLYTDYDQKEITEPYFSVRPLRLSVVQATSLIKLTEGSIAEHLSKSKNKIETGDHAGAITSAYTLIEGFLKEILRRTNTDFKDNEGDIRELYKLAAEPLNLNPKGENLESYLKTILDGLKKQISGLFEIANKASDRHERKYNPARHHAELAVNTAFTLCEFLLASFEYQQEIKKRKTAS
jgi:HEPN domain-containing protein